MSLATSLSWRQPVYDTLRGRGIEIGAFENPAQLPAGCRVEYCDVITPEQARQLFPELTAPSFTKIDHIVNLDTQGLRPFRNAMFDFVIMNHVIEHLVNPIRVVGELLRVLRPGGVMVLSAPDRDYTLDRNRPLTSFEHLYNDYVNNVTSASPEEYLDIPRYVFPEFMQLPIDELRAHLLGCQRRREHLHVWTAASFRDFLGRSFTVIGEQPELIFESLSVDNNIEYFSAWRRAHPRGLRGLLSRLRYRR